MEKIKQPKITVKRLQTTVQGALKKQHQRLEATEKLLEEIKPWTWDVAGKLNGLAKEIEGLKQTKPKEAISDADKLVMSQKLNSIFRDIIQSLVLMNCQKKHDNIKFF